VENFRHTPHLLHDSTVSICAGGVLEISLSGQVGADEPISLETVRRHVAGRASQFRHLHIAITTTGGNAGEAFRIYDFLRAQPASISARATGKCLSAGMIILMAADLRSASAGTELLLHPASFQRDDVLPDRLTRAILQEQADNLAVTDHSMATLFANRTGWPEEWFAAEIETENLLSDVAAVETGLIHEFEGVTPDVDGEWPSRYREFNSDRICFPSFMCTPNYFAACRARVHSQACIR
jgi:ATP-dependent protease ClpP protease subunit